MCYHLISRVVCRIVIAAAGFSFSAAMPVSVATISLDGTWQAEAVPEARGETIPAAFTRTIPVPGHWPLMQPAVKDNMSDALWCRTTWKAPDELPPRVTLHIGKASFGTTVFVNGKKAGFFPYNFVASETEIRPFLKPGVENEIVVRLGNAWLQNGKGRTMAHSGCDPERFHYYQGITDSVTLLLSGWPAVRRLETRADLEAGVVNVRATVQNGSADAVPAKLDAAVGSDTVSVLQGRELAPGEEREIVFAIPLSGFDRERDCWTPENPVLKTLTVKTAGDEMSRRFGMRTFDANPATRRFRLNGRDRMLFGTNTDLFRFYDDPQCGDKPWNRAWMRAFFAQVKAIGWDSFRNCISAPPDFWYDLCDEMGLLIQDEYPYWGCHVKPFVDQSLNKGRPPSPYCDCNPDTLFPELLAWVRERGMHSSIVFIDLQNETVKDWFDALAHRIQPYDFQRRPIDTGWSVNTIPNSPVECHPYLFCKTKYTLGYIAPGGIGVPFSCGRNPRNSVFSRPVVLNEFGWHWISRDGVPTPVSKQNYDYFLPGATKAETKEYYAWSIGVLAEAWRLTRKASALFHFTSLTHGFDDPTLAFTGDVLDPDLAQPKFRPEIVRYFRPAFAPVAVAIDDFREYVVPGTEHSFDVVLMNDGRDGRAAKRKIVFSAGDFHREEFELTAPLFGIAKRRVTVRVPETAKGRVMLTATLSDGTFSERRWNVRDRKPGFEVSAKITASSQRGDRHVGYMVDGSPLTHWESLQGDKRPWVKIDLGAERDVKECKVQWYHIWKPPTKWHLEPALPARTRYVTVKVEDIAPNGVAAIDEIEIH